MFFVPVNDKNVQFVQIFIPDAFNFFFKERHYNCSNYINNYIKERSEIIDFFRNKYNFRDYSQLNQTPLQV